MAKYRITGPDGNTYRVEAPDDASQEDVLAMVAQQSGAPAAAAKPTLATQDPSEYDPASPEYKAKYGAASGGTDWQNFWAGAGKSVMDLGRGVRQIGAEGADLVTGGNRGAELRAEQDQNNANDADLMGTKAGLAGDVAGNLATTLLPAGVVARGAQLVRLGRTARAARAFLNPTTYRAAAAAGAIQGGLAPVGTDDSRTLDAGVGAVTGGAARLLSGVVGRVAQPLTRALRPEDTTAVNTLLDAGVPLDAAQRSGSRGATALKRAVADNPMTAPAQAAFVEHQGRAFTRAVLGTIGENADSATSDVMGAARARIGRVFDDVAERNPVRYDGQLNHDIATLSHQAHRELVPADYSVIGNQVSDIFEKAQQGNGHIDGAAYQNLRTSLGRVAEQRSPLGHWAGQLRGVLDDALQRSADGEDLAALRTARSQYRRMLQIEGAIDNEGGGMISPSKLANSLGTKSNRAQSKYGRGDQTLVELAHAGKRLLPDKFPNSGTAARIGAQLAPALAVGSVVGGSTGDYREGAAAGVGTAALLAGARGGLNNQLIANYLANGLPGTARNALLLPGRASLPNVAASAALANRPQ